ncbi:MAG TPA: hypothetical protein VLE97_01800 [Gaiellaceae bacterium]|nr:hypothetical protein [Gaiellaceae bacterium]
MTGNVVSLADRRKDPHSSGEAICLDCKHTWAAVAPTGTVWLECPGCGLTRGRFRYQHERTGAAHWTCKCGNDLFHVTPDGYYCPNCGVEASGF